LTVFGGFLSFFGGWGDVFFLYQAVYRIKRKENAMSHKLFYWTVSLIILIFALFASNLPVEGAQLYGEAEIAAASTLQAMVTPQTTASSLPTLTEILPSSTPTSQAAYTSTPTYSVPMLTLRDATNCRTGPGLAYEIIVTYPVSQTLEIVGRYEPGNFWLVKSSESPTGICWLWGEYADVAGSYWAVPMAAAPPPTPLASVTPRPSRPQAPSLQDFKYYCDGINNTLTFQMIWEDQAANETGYRIYRDGWQTAELPAGSTAYAETIPMPAERSAQYSVQAYNATGSESMSVERVTCS
jgi:hypothetical protein